MSTYQRTAEPKAKEQPKTSAAAFNPLAPRQTTSPTLGSLAKKHPSQTKELVNSWEMISDHFGRDSDKESPGLSRTASAVNPYAQAKSGSGNMLGAVLKKQSSF